MSKKIYTCKNCGKTTKFHNHFEYHFSWSNHSLCPMCYDKTNLASIEMEEEKTNYMPTDPALSYWRWVTLKYLIGSRS